jgi:hypothetical protein
MRRRNAAQKHDDQKEKFIHSCEQSLMTTHKRAEPVVCILCCLFFKLQSKLAQTASPGRTIRTSASIDFALSTAPKPGIW